MSRAFFVSMIAAALVFLGSWVPPPASAHHSAAMFDHEKLVILRGEILSFSYINPHAWISVMAAPNGEGEAKRWDIEATSPRTLEDLGITRTTLKPGDKVTIGTRPLRDGRPGGSFVFVVTADGKHYGADLAKLGLKVEDLRPR
jgi:hypothetical protein